MTNTNTNPADILLERIAGSNEIVAAAIQASSQSLAKTYQRIDAEIEKLLANNQGGLVTHPEFQELNRNLMSSIFQLLENNLRSMELNASEKKSL